MDDLAPIIQGYQIGCDIGQQVDPTAIIVAELQLRAYRRIHPIDGDDWRYGDVTGGEIHYVIRHIERLELRTPYPKVIDRLAAVYAATRARASRRQSFACYVDATGVGRPVIDACAERGLDVYAVTLTGGEKETRAGREIRLAKQELVSRMQIMLQNRQVHFPDTPAAAAHLSQAVADELLNYEIRVTENANLKMGVFRTGAHDDLATALGLACRPATDRTLEIADAPEALRNWRG